MVDDGPGAGPVIIGKLPESKAAAPAAPKTEVAVTTTHIDLCRLLNGPIEGLLAWNDAHRRADVGIEGLFGYDAIRRAAMLVDYRFERPTLVPESYAPLASAPTIQVYQRRLETVYPWLDGVLKINNVVVAGGAAIYPFGDLATLPGDIDLFLCGLTTEAEIWSTVDKIQAKIQEAHKYVLTTLTPGLVTFDIRDNYTVVSGKLKVQVILRAYPSVSALLHAFDIPSACVAYDGLSVYSTALGALALTKKVNIVNPAYRSTTYERRLHKYFNRGFGIVFPGLAPWTAAGASSVECGAGTVELPFLKIHITSCEGNFAVGHLDNPAGAESDYEPTVPTRPFKYGDPIGLITVGAHQVIARSFVGGRNFNMLMGYQRPFIHANDQHSNTDSRSTLEWRATSSNSSYTRQSIRFESFASKTPTFKTLLPREDLVRVLKTSSSSVLSGGTTPGGVNIRILHEVYGYSLDEIQDIVAKMLPMYLSKRGYVKFDLARILESRVSDILARYDATEDFTPQWIIMENPGRQFTASLNPEILDPAEWYGSFGAGAADPEASKAGIQAWRMRHAAKVDADEDSKTMDCVICMSTVSPGDRNTITTSCGHCFHWSPTADCGGTTEWIKTNKTCPVCRNAFMQAPKTKTGLNTWAVKPDDTNRWPILDISL